MVPTNLLLAGVVGSTAYGLAGPGSDVDRLGLFAAPTEAVLGLTPPKDTHVTNKPDATYHEAAKWCRLALGGNPTAMELVWLDEYETRTPLGDELIGIRSAFLSAHRVRDAYLGYAIGQFGRLTARGDGSFSADTRKRTAKHARHLARLCQQGYELYTTGKLTIRVHNPEELHKFGERVADGALNDAEHLIAMYKHMFEKARTVLPDEPDRTPVEAWLLRARRAHLAPA
ncbi:nucleotidyltransferase domain-containing protein [Micromonospora pisi]|nr:nucleotidyltransferase domain-containing protein [Micromonospora pisi]